MIASWRRSVAVTGMLCAFSAGCIVEEEAPASVDDDVASEPVESTPLSCMTHTACPSGYLCGFASGTCGAQGGTCQAFESAPANSGGAICGCDGVDYPSAAAAWAGGVSIWLQSTCDGSGEQVAPPPPEPALDCAAGCATGEFCFSEDGTCGDSGQGTCRSMNGVCTSAANPVCGCNGVTYPSMCDAAESGASLDHHGPC